MILIKSTMSQNIQAAIFLLFILIKFSNQIINYDDRIVGGTTITNEKEHPYIVSLREISGNFICSGAIISIKWVLTTGSCTYGRKPSETIIIAGTTNLGGTGTKHNVEKLISHPSYGSFVLSFLSMDIGLVKVVQPMYPTPFTQPIQLSTNYVSDGFPGVICGWGSKAKNNSKENNLLECTDFRTISNFKCRLLIFPLNVNPSTLCAMPKYQTGLCDKDEGNPFVSNGVLIGISTKTSACGKRTPHYFSRVSYFLRWIKNVIEN